MQKKKALDAENAANLEVIAGLVGIKWLNEGGLVDRRQLFKYVTNQVLPDSPLPRPSPPRDYLTDCEFLIEVECALSQQNCKEALIPLRKYTSEIKSLMNWFVGQVASAKAFAKVLDAVNACENDWVIRNREAILKCYAMIYLAYPTKASYKQLVHPEVMCFITRALHTNYIYDTLELKSARISWPVLRDFLNCQSLLSSMVLRVHGRDEWKEALLHDQMDKDIGYRLVSEFFVRYEGGDYDPFLGEHNDIIWKLIR